MPARETPFLCIIHLNGVLDSVSGREPGASGKWIFLRDFLTFFGDPNSLKHKYILTFKEVQGFGSWESKEKRGNLRYSAVRPR